MVLKLFLNSFEFPEHLILFITYLCHHPCQISLIKFSIMNCLTGWVELPKALVANQLPTSKIWKF